jgi:hypothetical protein
MSVFGVTEIDLARARVARAVRAATRRTLARAAGARAHSAGNLARAESALHFAEVDLDDAVSQLHLIHEDWEFDDWHSAELAHSRAECASAKRALVRAQHAHNHARLNYNLTEHAYNRAERALGDCEPIDLLDILNLALRRTIFLIRSENHRSKPPALAEYLLELLASPELSESAAGDFFEKYNRKFKRVRAKHGVYKARLDYWWQVARSVPGLLRIRIRHFAIIGIAAKIFQITEKYWKQ